VDIDEALHEIGLPSIAGSIFEQMEIAEEEINQAKVENPGKENELFNAFTLLRPAIPRMTDPLYHLHCKEILKRVALGGDTRPPTKAERLQFLMDASLKAPPKNDAAVLQWQLFTDLFGEEKKRYILGIAKDVSEPHETYPGATNDINTDLIRWLTQDWRKL